MAKSQLLDIFVAVHVSIRDCTPTDHIQHLWPMFLRRLNDGIPALVHYRQTSVVMIALV